MGYNLFNLLVIVPKVGELQLLKQDTKQDVQEKKG